MLTVNDVCKCMEGQVDSLSFLLSHMSYIKRFSKNLCDAWLYEIFQTINIKDSPVTDIGYNLRFEYKENKVIFRTYDDTPLFTFTLLLDDNLVLCENYDLNPDESKVLFIFLIEVCSYNDC